MRRLLLGRAGSGKTHICLDRLAAAIGSGQRALMLVPTYSQAEHLRGLLLDRVGGLGARTVETFSSLAERVTKQPLRQLVPPPVRDRIARSVLARFFPKAAGQPGFRAEFLASVKEIKELGLSPDAALAHAQAHFSAGSRGRLLFQAYAGYADALPGPDHEDLLLRTRDELAVDLDLMLVDGFHDLTPVEKQIVDRLADCSNETIVTLPARFDTAKRTAASFEGFEREELGGNRRGFAELERRLFTDPDGTISGEGIEVIACASEEDEADRLARAVVRAGRPFHDFLVVRRSFDGLFGLYRATFRRHGIPLRFFGTEPLGNTPAARAATLFLRFLLDDVAPLDLLPLLRSPYLLDAPPMKNVDQLARELRDKGEALIPLVRPEGSLPDVLQKHLGLRHAIVALPDGDEDLARAARFFKKLTAEADAVGDLELPDAALHVLRRIPLLRGAVPDRRHDCVYAVEAMDARQWEKPVVMVAGLTADEFPRQIRQDLFLRDDERKAFGRERGVHLPLRSRKEDEERYLFYVALTRATERLVLTWPAFDEEGTVRAASPYLEDALQHLDGHALRAVPLSQQQVQARDAVCTDDLLPIVADGLAHGLPLAASLHDLGAVPRAQLAWPRRLELLRTRPIPDPPKLAHLSATAINDFRRCPYLFLIGRLLKVRPARERALDPLMRGTIVHAALERHVQEGRDMGELFDEIFAEETRGCRIGLGQESDRRWMRHAVLRAAEELRECPVHEAERMFEVVVGDVLLKGRIDRVDRYEAGDLIRDYKTGAARAGDVQLDAYLLAVENPAGAVYERLRHGDREGFVIEELKGAVPGRKVEQVTPGEIEERREQMRETVASVAAAARAGRLAVHPADPETCKRGKCDGFDLCRVARARWLARKARE